MKTVRIRGGSASWCYCRLFVCDDSSVAPRHCIPFASNGFTVVIVPSMTWDRVVSRLQSYFGDKTCASCSSVLRGFFAKRWHYVIFFKDEAGTHFCIKENNYYQYTYWCFRYVLFFEIFRKIFTRISSFSFFKTIW